jgi:hypothetical protein
LLWFSHQFTLEIIVSRAYSSGIHQITTRGLNFPHSTSPFLCNSSSRRCADGRSISSVSATHRAVTAGNSDSRIAARISSSQHMTYCWGVHSFSSLGPLLAAHAPETITVGNEDSLIAARKLTVCIIPLLSTNRVLKLSGGHTSVDCTRTSRTLLLNLA